MQDAGLPMLILLIPQYFISLNTSYDLQGFSLGRLPERSSSGPMSEVKLSGPLRVLCFLSRRMLALVCQIKGAAGLTSEQLCCCFH